MGVERHRFIGVRHYPIDRDTLVIPEIVVDTFDCIIATILRPIFDVVWNATGWPKSMNYNDSGEWIGQRRAS